jgi:hypothetical protein
MKKLFLIPAIVLYLTATAIAGPNVSNQGGGAGNGVLSSTNCNQSQYYPVNILCVQSDTGTLYQGTGIGIKLFGNGTNGLPIIWKGSFASAPSSPSTNWAYYDTVQKKSYVYDGSTWNIMTQDGAPGNNGTPGANGNTVLYGTAAPTTEGNNGDFYIRTSTNFIYGPKAAGSWPAGTSLIGSNGASAYVYIAYASDASGTGFTTTFSSSLDYIAIKTSSIPLTPVVGDFTGLWKNYKGATGGGSGSGSDGTSSYVYIAYASDASGTGFTQTYSSFLNYIAIKSTTSSISNPQASDFVGLWFNYKGPAGNNGTNGNTVLYGTAAPTTEGNNGDFYIRTSTNYIYGPKASGTWPAGTSLVGPQGNAGSAGAAGTNGLSIIWKGSLSSAPSSPSTNWAYYDTVQKKSYIYDGSSWNVMTQDGGVIIAGSTTPTAGDAVEWDPNLNLSANQFIPGFNRTTTTGGTVIMTIASAHDQVREGTLNETEDLPVASTLPANWSQMYFNNSTGTVTVNTSGGNTIYAIPPGGQLYVKCINPSGGTGISSWQAIYPSTLASLGFTISDSTSSTSSTTSASSLAVKTVNDLVNGKISLSSVLTGFTSNTGVVSASDSVLSAIEKLYYNFNAVIGTATDGAFSFGVTRNTTYMACPSGFDCYGSVGGKPVFNRDTIAGSLYQTLATTGANTFVDTQTFTASTTSGPSIVMPHGTAPTSPVNGACWTTTSGLYCRINGATIGPYAVAGGSFVGGTLTSSLTLRAGTTTASTAPIYFQASSLLTAAAAYAFETNGTNLYFTNSTPTRKQIAFTDSAMTGNTSGTSAGLSATLSPASGGTGVANNAASTITINGAHPTTFTVSDTTNITLPTSGTVSTLAGSETITNKNQASVISTSTGTGNINIDGVSYNDYNYNNDSSTATYTFVATSAPASNTYRPILLTVGGGSGVITKIWTNVTWMGTAGSSTTVTNKYDHYVCKVMPSTILCAILAEGSTK